MAFIYALVYFWPINDVFLPMQTRVNGMMIPDSFCTGIYPV